MGMCPSTNQQAANAVSQRAQRAGRLAQALPSTSKTSSLSACRRLLRDRACTYLKSLMPRRIPWQETAIAVNADAADAVLESLKSFDIAKSNTSKCTACPGSEPHKSRYRLLECSSDACHDASEFKYAWRGRMITCLESNLVSVHEFGQHTSDSDSDSSQRKKLTSAQKQFCRELAEHHQRPLRIRHALARKFATPLADLPNLKVVQNFVNHYSRTYLENHDRVDGLREWIQARTFTGNEAMAQPFTFGWELNPEGKPVVGNGSDEKPFIVGITTKALVLRMMLPPDSFILHVDATYKMNYREYPVFVICVSDRSRGFHVVALFVISQETQPVIEATLLALQRLYFWIARQHLVVQHAMADADQAQFNALRFVFGSNPRFGSLMCFFHVMEKVHTAIKNFPSVVSASIVHDMYDMHFARSELEFFRMRDYVLQKWSAMPLLVGFAQYMSAQWLFGWFSTWQVYATPSGFASTNNPAETFNALLKRDYTLRRRLKMGTLLRELSDCCENQSANTRQFRFDSVPATTLTRRVGELTREKLLGLWSGEPVRNAYPGGPTIVPVVCQLAKRLIVAPNKRSEEGIAVSAQMGSNYARMEVQGQPFGGWPVDVDNKWCPCNYFFAFGVCVHVLFALRITEHLDSSGREILVTRKKRKRAPATTTNAGGRPRSVGAALCLE